MTTYSKKTLEHLMDLIAQTAECRPDLADRLGRAYDLLLRGWVRPCDFHRGDFIVKASAPKKKDQKKASEYRLTPKSCSCPDFVARGVKSCKHRLATRLWLIAESAEAAHLEEQQRDQAVREHRNACRGERPPTLRKVM